MQNAAAISVFKYFIGSGRGMVARSFDGSYLLRFFVLLTTLVVTTDFRSVYLTSVIQQPSLCSALTRLLLTSAP